MNTPTSVVCLIHVSLLTSDSHLIVVNADAAEMSQGLGDPVEKSIAI